MDKKYFEKIRNKIKLTFLDLLSFIPNQIKSFENKSHKYISVQTRVCKKNANLAAKLVFFSQTDFTI